MVYANTKTWQQEVGALGLDDVPPFRELLCIRDAVAYAAKRGHQYPRMSLNHDLLAGRLVAGVDAWLIGNRWYISVAAIERRMKERELSARRRRAQSG